MPKIVADRFQERQLRLVHRAVGLGDEEQAVDDVGERFPVVGVKGGDAGGVGVVAGDVALGEIEEARDVALLARRHAEDVAEGSDFGGRDHAVGLRHLGGERDQRDRERDLTARRSEMRRRAIPVFASSEPSAPTPLSAA